MKNLNLGLFILMLGLLTSCSDNNTAAATASASQTSTTSEKSTAMKEPFVHAVYFWLKEPENQEARKKFEASLKNFIKQSAYVRSSHVGTPAPTSRPVIDSSYSYSLVVTFDSKEDQDKYQDEPVHLKFIEECKDLWEKVVVYDSIAL